MLLNASKRYFTKTLFNIAYECPTKLYYCSKEDYPSVKDDDEFLNSLAEGGFQVGALAKCYHPEGIEVLSLEHEDAIKQTNDLLKKDKVTILEAAISFENFFVRVDILIKMGNYLELIEVKSKSYHPQDDRFLTKSGRISSEWSAYLYDVAFQTCILQKALPQFSISPYLMVVDKSKTTSVDGLNQRFRLQRKNDHSEVVINGDISLEALGVRILTTVSVSEYVKMIWAENDQGQEAGAGTAKSFLGRVREYAQYYEEDKRFPVTIGQKCKTCEFCVTLEELGVNQKSGFKECWKTQLGWGDKYFEKPLVFNVCNFRYAQECMDSGIYLMEDIPLEDFLMKRNKKGQSEFISPTAERQHLQIVKSCHDKEAKEVVNPALFGEMENWNFPLHFIDFETSMVAIPFSKGRRPYELIAFQFSCHTIHDDGRVEHTEWIEKQPGKFPNFDFLVALKKTLESDGGTIFRYTHYENSVLREIYNQLQRALNSDQETLPPNPEHLLTWIGSITQWKEPVQFNGKTKEVSRSGDRNMVDMWKLVKRFYYHPMMRSSNSIKVVLPAVLSASEFLKEKYSKQYTSKNYSNMIWWRPDERSGLPVDPYTLLPPLFEDVDISKDMLFLENQHIQEGGAAMLAYAKMQFSEMTSEERQGIIKGLLKYCELDTLAMVMIYEHWNYVKNKLVCK